MARLLDVRNLTIEFSTAQGRVTAVRDVRFHIDEAEVMGLVGESGSGKSVTSLAVLRLLPPQARIGGEVVFRGEDLLRLSVPAMQRIRGSGISMIFQEPMTALNPVMRVGDQIAEAVLAHSAPSGESKFAATGEPPRPRLGPSGSAPDNTVEGRATRKHVSKSDAWRLGVEALRTVAISEPDRRARDYPYQLSGGQRQRVMIAMAVVNRPWLLIADEPTTALDVTIQAQVLDLLCELRKKFALAMLFISHDLAVVSQVSNRIGVMYAGSLVEMGTAQEVFRRPLHPYTRGLLNSVPTLRTDRAKPLQSVEGTVPSVAAMPPGCAFEPRCSKRIASCEEDLPPLVEVSPGHFARCPVIAGEAR